MLLMLDLVDVQARRAADLLDYLGVADRVIRLMDGRVVIVAEAVSPEMGGAR